MEQDVTSLLRRLINSGPRWVRAAVISSIVIGLFLQIVVKLTAPRLPIIYNISSSTLNSLAWYEWAIIGCMLAFPSAFMWRMIKLVLRIPHSNREKAEEYIEIMKLGLKEGGLSAIDERFYWRSMMSKLMDLFNVGADPPSARRVFEEIQSD